MKSNQPNLSEFMRALDDLAAAAASGDVERYRQALDTTSARQATEEQTLDAYRWGRRTMDAADFDHHGRR